MSNLSRNDILVLARLARLRLDEQAVAVFQKELNAILSYVEQLNTVDTAGLEPTYQLTGLTNVMRADKIIDYGVDTQSLLKNVPHRKGDYIKVKRVLE